MMDEHGIGRRSFLELTGAAGIAALGGGGSGDFTQVDDSGLGLDPDVQQYGILVGRQAERPPAGGSYLSQWDSYAFLYVATDTGSRAIITHKHSNWREYPLKLLNVAEADLPVGTEGTIVWNTDRTVPGFYDGNDIDYPVIGDDVTITPVTVSNTTTETDIWDAGLDQGSIKVRRVYKVKLYGRFSNASTSDMVTIRIYVGGTLIASVTSTGKNASNAPWNLHTTMTVLEQGASGTIQPHTQATFNNVNADDHHNSVTVDTAVPDQIEATVQWNDARAGNTFTLDQGYMKEIA